MGSRAGLESSKILALGDYASSAHYDERERAALVYADAITTAGSVEDEVFERVRQHFSGDALVELTTLIAWENASSRFNRALRLPAQGLWKGGQG